MNIIINAAVVADRWVARGRCKDKAHMIEVENRTTEKHGTSDACEIHYYLYTIDYIPSLYRRALIHTVPFNADFPTSAQRSTLLQLGPH